MMRKEASSQLLNGSRTDPSRVKTQAKQRARMEADRQTEQLKARLGEYAIEAVEEYFPEQYRAKRRAELAQVFVGGLLLGLLVRELLRAK